MPVSIVKRSGNVLFRQLLRRRAVVMCYHGVVPDESLAGWRTADMVGETVFRDHLALYERHYQVVPLRSIVDAAQAQRRLDKRLLAITFDDGFANNAQTAAAALNERGFPAAFFLTTGFIDGLLDLWWVPLKRAAIAALADGRPLDIEGLETRSVNSEDDAARAYDDGCRHLKTLSVERRSAAVDALRRRSSGSVDALGEVYRPMTWDDARRLAASGMTIGAHTVSHAVLSCESGESANREITESIERVRREVGGPWIPFAYPNGQPGDFGPRDAEAIRQAGGPAAFANALGWIGSGANPYTLPRFPIGGYHTVEALSLELSGVKPLARRVLKPFRKE